MPWNTRPCPALRTWTRCQMIWADVCTIPRICWNYESAEKTVIKRLPRFCRGIGNSWVEFWLKARTCLSYAPRVPDLAGKKLLRWGSFDQMEKGTLHVSAAVIRRVLAARTGASVSFSPTIGKKISQSVAVNLFRRFCSIRLFL